MLCSMLVMYAELEDNHYKIGLSISEADTSPMGDIERCVMIPSYVFMFWRFVLRVVVLQNGLNG